MTDPPMQICQVCQRPIPSNDRLNKCTVCNKMFGTWCCHWQYDLCVKHKPENWTAGEADPSVENMVREEEEILTDEGEEASSQWVKQMMKVVNAPMSFQRKVGHCIVIFLAAAVVIQVFAAPTRADSSVPQLQ